jgi:hypothetical protein
MAIEVIRTDAELGAEIRGINLTKRAATMRTRLTRSKS